MPTVEERFWAKIEKTEDGCWLWIGARTKRGSKGYGVFWNGTRQVLAHRYSFELAGGVIPEGMQIDHLCRVRPCVNPAHLEPVTPSVNTLRGDLKLRNLTHCQRCGLELQWRPNGRQRQCIECQRNSQRRYYARRRAKRVALGLRVARPRRLPAEAR